MSETNLGISVWGISHPWVSVEERVYLTTPINAREWPVPLPNDCNINLICIEMLQHKAEYVWLESSHTASNTEHPAAGCSVFEAARQGRGGFAG